MSAVNGSGRRTVLVGFAEALAAPETLWSLREHGHEVVAFTRRGRRPALRRMRDLPLVEIEAPERDLHRASVELEDAVTATRATAVMPLDDAAVHLCAAGFGSKVEVVGPTGRQARLALDKRVQIEAAAAAGFSVPATRTVSTAAEALSQMDFPLVIKPAEAVADDGGRLVRGSCRVCANRRELEAAVEAWQERHPLLVQPLLDGVGEGLFGLAGADGVLAWSSHRRVRMMNPQGSGSSACRAVPVDESLLGPAERFLRAERWRGLFMLELLRDDEGIPWFMELNGRAWGSMALARRVGHEYPAWAVAERSDPRFRPSPAVLSDEITCRHLGRELVHLLMVMRGPRSSAQMRWPSRLRTVRDVLSVHRGDRWYNWRPGDTRFFIEDTVATLREQVLGRAR